MINPFREGTIYHAGFKYWQKKVIVTRIELAEAIERTGLTNKANPEAKYRAAYLSATILLSPRLSSKRGDCRGNVCTYGHIYYAEPLKKENGEEKKYKLCWREEILDKINYIRPSQMPKDQIEQVKLDISSKIPVDTIPFL